MRVKKSAMIIDTGEDLLSLIESGDKDAFTAFYSDNFRKLLLVSDKYVKGIHVAEEIVQNIFLKIWEDTSALKGINSMKAYLYRSVVNASINHINREKNIEKHHSIIAEHLTEADIDTLDEQNELIVLLHDEIDRLPAKCQKVFRLSRLEGKKYRDIAVELGISEKTVENHMSNALKTLRAQVLIKTTLKNGKNGNKYHSLMTTFLF